MLMNRNNNNLNLTNRDMDILNILWNSEKSMTASEIVSVKPGLTTNTVQAVLRKLLKNEMIKVADIVYSGTVLSRSYTPTISSEDFALMHLRSEFQSLNKKISKASIVATLLDTDKDDQKMREEIEKLEILLEEYKRNL